LSSPPSTAAPGNRLSAFLLALAYLLLVLVVVAGAFWIQSEFNRAQQERCEILTIQIKLAKLEVAILKANVPPPPPDQQQSIEDRADMLRGQVLAACPEADL
jgi:hypothetical protein